MTTLDIHPGLTYHWVQELISNLGFDVNNVAHVSIAPMTMTVVQYQVNDRGLRFIDPRSGEVATTRHNFPLDPDAPVSMNKNVTSTISGGVHLDDPWGDSTNLMPVNVAAIGHNHQLLMEIPGFGKADHCEAFTGQHRPAPVRFVWHHLLPQICGGKSVEANLVQLCDSCHLTVHYLMFQLAQVDGDRTAMRRIGTTNSRGFALQGYLMAKAAGTDMLLPNEGGSVPA